MKNNKNFVLFMVLALVLMLGWMQLSNLLWPPPEKKAPDEQKAAKVEADKKDKQKKPDVEPPKRTPENPGDLAVRAARAVASAAVRPVVASRELILGTDSDNLKAVLDSRGASVLSVVLPKFQQADSLGRPVWLDPEKKIPQPLELVMRELNQDTPSHLLFHFDPNRKGNDPLPDLGQRDWSVTEEIKDEEGVVRSVAFSTDIDGVRITKTYTLRPGDYHLGLEVRLERIDGADDKPFRYQLTSAHGLRIEGDWYSSVLRNALIGYRDTKSGNFLRTLEEARRIAFRLGGDPIEVNDGDKQIRWAGVAVQFFASMVVVDDEGQENQSFLARARPTLEGAALKGRIKKISEDRKQFELVAPDGTEYKFQVDPRLEESFRHQREGSSVAVIYTLDDYDQRIALRFQSDEMTEPLFYNDVLVRLTTEPVDLKAGPVTHRYLLYNGPVKPRLLGYLGGAKEVPQDLIHRYEKRLHLDKITDYPSNRISEALDTVYFTQLLIACTNLMHSILWALHTYVMPWSYGLCIILLTVLVRGMMFPVSRKQAMTSIRMQELAPELKKLQEKYKNDRQALGMAQMELYRKNGVHPLGTCWLLFLQMPIFLGLYYCLQESIMFRLAPFAWMDNLAAPDMLIWWGEHIPFISRPGDREAMILGFIPNFFFLGPYFNLLPVVAVALMIAQQSMMTPPALDDQQRAQMKMMKYMMVFFGLMFYKVAAGLCVYFIASSLWGFAERKLLPKRKPAAGTAGPAADEQAGLLQRLRERWQSIRPGAPSSAISTAPASGQEANGPAMPPRNDAVAPSAPGAAGQRKKGKRKKGKGGRGEAGPAPAATPPNGVSGRVRSWWTGLREWWAEALRQAEKK